MKQRQSRGLMPWILTLLCAVLLTVWVLGSMPAAPKEGAAVAAGTAYLDSAAAKDASAIAETLREREKQRRAELLAQQKKEERDALVAKITSGELDIWSMFDSYVILGDSRAVGFYYFDFLEKSRVLADGGNTIRDVAAHMDDIRALQPDYVYLCYGLNDISICYWDTKEEYVAELLQVVADLKEALPGVTVVVSSILPAQDPAFEKSSKWRNIPEWSEAVGAACAENGIPFADNTEICQTYADLWQPDGIHVRPEFYPYWAANLILAGLDSPAEAEDTTNETENDPA